MMQMQNSQGSSESGDLPPGKVYKFGQTLALDESDEELLEASSQSELSEKLDEEADPYEPVSHPALDYLKGLRQLYSGGETDCGLIDRDSELKVFKRLSKLKAKKIDGSEAKIINQSVLATAIWNDGLDSLMRCCVNIGPKSHLRLFEVPRVPECAVRELRVLNSHVSRSVLLLERQIFKL